MSGFTGREAKIAFAKFATGSWGVATSVTKGHYFTGTPGLTLAPARINDEAIGNPFLGRGDLGDVAPPDLTWVGRSRYDDYGYIMDALAMGSPAAVTVSTSTGGQTTSYEHVIDMANDIDGLGLTLAVDKGSYIDELTSAKVFGFSEAVGDGGVIDRTYRLMGSKPTNTSVINTNSVLADATYPALGNRIMRNQGVFRMNAQSGNSLVAANAVKVETVEISFERPQDAPHVFGQDYIHEPADNGFPTVRITVQYPRMTASSAGSLYAALQNNQAWKADLKYLGSYINSTDRYMRLYEFPHVELDEWNGAELDGANQVKPQATFSAKLAATSPANMPVVNPMRLTLINTQSLVAF